MFRFFSSENRVFNFLSGIGIPVAIIFSSWIVSSSLAKAKIDAEYVQIAVNILQQPPNDGFQDSRFDDTKEKLALRQWAIQLLSDKSPVPMTNETKSSLLEANLEQCKLEYLMEQIKRNIDEQLKNSND